MSDSHFYPRGRELQAGQVAYSRGDTLPHVRTSCAASNDAAVHERYKAILSEVEGLSHQLRVTIEGRTAMEQSLNEELRRATKAISERDETVKQQEVELMHMRGMVEILTSRLEFYEENRRSRNVSRRSRSVSRKSSPALEAATPREDGSPTTARGFLTPRRSSRTKPKRAKVTTPPSLKEKDVMDIVNETVPLSVYNNCASVAQKGLNWVKFMLERCIVIHSSTHKEDDTAKDNVNTALGFLKDLQGYYTSADADHATINSHCAHLSNCLVKLANDAAARREGVDGPSEGISDREQRLRVLVSTLAKERDVLKKQAKLIARENLRLLGQLNEDGVAPSS
ncbi:hypothetical protein ERJ75_001458600 [Trypanosoma vivax]|nr:hypothetical protein ERJ75_001458600 [Trypanosoma vivax]